MCKFVKECVKLIINFKEISQIYNKPQKKKKCLKCDISNNYYNLISILKEKKIDAYTTNFEFETNL